MNTTQPSPSPTASSSRASAKLSTEVARTPPVCSAPSRDSWMVSSSSTPSASNSAFIASRALSKALMLSSPVIRTAFHTRPGGAASGAPGLASAAASMPGSSSPASGSPPATATAPAISPTQAEARDANSATIGPVAERMRPPFPADDGLHLEQV